MSAGKYDLTLEQGATVTQVLTWKDYLGTPVNLTGFTARMQARRQVNDLEILLDLTTANSGIVLGGVLGTVAINISAAATALISGVAVYDLELVSGSSVVTRLVEGKIFFSPQVTR